VAEIEGEIQVVMRQAMDRALAIVQSNGATLLHLADELATHESVEGIALDTVLAAVVSVPGPAMAPLLASAFSS
jgi:hypothetical protein